MLRLEPKYERKCECPLFEDSNIHIYYSKSACSVEVRALSLSLVWSERTDFDSVSPSELVSPRPFQCNTLVLTFREGCQSCLQNSSH